MVVNEEILKYVKELAGDSRYSKAVRYVREKRVMLSNIDYIDDSNFEIEGRVIGGGDIYNIHVEVQNGNVIDRSCSCPDYDNYLGYCKHITAAILELNERKEYDEKESNEEPQGYGYNTIRRSKSSDSLKYKEANKLMDIFSKNPLGSESEIKDVPNGSLKLEVRLIGNRFVKYHIEVSIGINRLYKIKDIYELYQNIINNNYKVYGKALACSHGIEKFNDASRDVIKLILAYGRAYDMTNTSKKHRFGDSEAKTDIALNGYIADLFYKLMQNKWIKTDDDISESEEIFVTEGKPDFKFEFVKYKKDEYILTADCEKYIVIEGSEMFYLISEDTMISCNKDEYTQSLKALSIINDSVSKNVLMSRDIVKNFFQVVYPKLKSNFDFEAIEGTELEDFIPLSLGVKIYLDYEGKNIEANVKFCYDEIEFNPFDNDEEITIVKNIDEEKKAIDEFSKVGFNISYEKKKMILEDDNDIYYFLKYAINDFMNKYEVLASEEFAKREIRKPKIGTIGVRIKNDLLNINLDNMDFDIEELEDIIAGYRLKKKFHRLKDGTLIDLEENEDLDFITKMTTNVEAKLGDIKDNMLELPISRSLYLNKLLSDTKSINIEKDEEYTDLVDTISGNKGDAIVPSELEDILRYYQKSGYKWLKALDSYKMGGILADDMGLGKTLQLISVLLEYKNSVKAKDRKTSIVVCPSSLTLNWAKEINKFAPDINVMILRGTASERHENIANMNKYDVVITSYDLLKRDIEKYNELNYVFRYIIADEAQYIKNSTTKNSLALKKIKAETRFALTGTPIENSLSELWSIFDFIMPGYLFTYPKFKNMYEVPIVRDEDSLILNVLKKQIEPFILRRLKKDVLKELPDKTITILNNEMEDKQKKLYLAYLKEAKKEVDSEVKDNGFAKSQIRILSLLTRLRQICCHPSLFIEDYNGDSSKFDQCIEIVRDSVSSGHKILLFSQYTSMFGLIEEEFKKNEINYFKLTGSTKVDERIRMVDEFNTNPDIKVFLISLKAGGTGLNLTGADVVIHYDPWWNLSAENQATDRAYRIGQKNNVQVYKLITKNTIEEKIYALQEKKAKLSENMLSTEETFINKLSKDDILSLFEE